MDKHVIEILKEQCRIVGADYEKIDFKEDMWFMDHEWTKEQEAEFIQWVTDYLYNNKEARNMLLQHPYKNKTTCKKAAEQFAFNYGWKYKK